MVWKEGNERGIMMAVKKNGRRRQRRIGDKRHERGKVQVK